MSNQSTQPKVHITPEEIAAFLAAGATLLGWVLPVIGFWLRFSFALIFVGLPPALITGGLAAHTNAVFVVWGIDAANT
jgi:hypothetical protein